MAPFFVVCGLDYPSSPFFFLHVFSFFAPPLPHRHPSIHPAPLSVSLSVIQQCHQIELTHASPCPSPFFAPGCVKLARHRKTNEQVAVKIISKASLANRAAVHRGIEREIAIMKLINHPHVIRLYDVYETEKEL